MSIWVAYMYRNRPEIISQEESISYGNIINVEFLDKNASRDLESSNNSSFDDNQSTNSNSQYCSEELAALRNL